LYKKYSNFYGLAADRQEYCFTKDFCLFFFFFFFFFLLFLNFIFEPQQLFFQIRVKKIHEGGLSLLFQIFC